jgi:hypothetical protein
LSRISADTPMHASQLSRVSLKNGGMFAQDASSGTLDQPE